MTTPGFDQETDHEIQATAVALSGLYHSLASKSAFLLHLADIRTSNRNVRSIKIKCPILCLVARQLCLRNHKVHFFLPCATSFRGGKLSDVWTANSFSLSAAIFLGLGPSPQGLGQIVLGSGNGYEEAEGLLGTTWRQLNKFTVWGYSVMSTIE